MLEKVNTEESQDPKCDLMWYGRLPLRKGPSHPLKFLTERIHPGQLVESHLLKSHFTGYPHEILCLMSSDLISIKLLHFSSLPAIQALEEVAKCKC